MTDDKVEVGERRRVVTVMHRAYGCETGCCGHAIEVNDQEVKFGLMDHPDSDDDAVMIEWARRFVAEELGEDHVADLDWENSYVSADW